MIIADIGHSKFLINNLADAEKLLRIFGEAKQIDRGYIGDDAKRFFYESPNTTSVEISVVSENKILSYDEYMKLKKESQTAV